MNCPKCGLPVSSRKRCCEACGTDLTVYRKIVRISNHYYNRGLEKARVRDLSGAIEELKRSLEMNKKNIDARNLLGLVYYETGETVAALSEWVISKHFQPEGNEAEVLLEKVQDNPIELDNTNQAIRKYNQALQAVKESNEDLAILQLKKVISLHPNYLRALQLLALLMIKNEEYDKARKYLARALEIDVANTTTLRYLAEIDRESSENPAKDNNAQWNNGADIDSDKTGQIAVRNTYREDKPNVMVFINLLIGVVIGIAVVYYLIVPTMRTNIKEEYESQKVDYSQELSSKTATINQQEKKIASLEKKAAELEEQVNGITTEIIEVDRGSEAYNNLFDVWTEYKDLKGREYSDEELEAFALKLWSMDVSGISNVNALELVESMRSYIYPLAAKKIYKAGKKLYDNEDYEAASGMLEAAVAFNPKNDAAMYYLGKCLQAIEMYDEAIYYYKLMLEVCPNSTLKDYIPQRLRECGDGT